MSRKPDMTSLQWREFVARMRTVFEARQSDAGIGVFVTETDGKGHYGVHRLGFNLQPRDLIPIVGNLIVALDALAPETKEIEELRDTYLRLFEKKVTTQ